MVSGPLVSCCCCFCCGCRRTNLTCIVGPACRFATGSVMYNSDSLIQEFYAKEATFPNPMQQAVSKGAAADALCSGAFSWRERGV